MADIFISYKKEDAGRVIRIVEGLREEGFTVWWDHGIAPGSQWDQAIQRELTAAKCVVAVWSEESISAPWVKEEAGVGKSRGALVPVRIDDVEPPLGFGLIQFADLIEWDGNIEDPHWDFFIESVRATLEGRPVKGLEKPARRRRLKFAPILAVLALAVIAGGGFVAFQMMSGGDLPVRAGGTDIVTASDGPTRPSDAEETMFQRVSETQLKTDYQDFLRSFPQGFYAKRVREEILPLCAAEQRDIWRANQTDNPVRGVSATEDNAGNSISFTEQADACASARRTAEYDADRFCKLVAGANDVQNISMSIADSECECTEVEANNSVWCLYDSVYSCSWETKSFEMVEVCG